MLTELEESLATQSLPDLRVLSGKATEQATKRVAAQASKDHSLLRALIVATEELPREWYDWSLGFILSRVDPLTLTQVVSGMRGKVPHTEGVAWGLGESGCDSPPVVNLLYEIAESCFDYDAWWCAAEALEKLRIIDDSAELKKRTLRGDQWDSLEDCLTRLESRPALIGALRLARFENTAQTIIPACRDALMTARDDPKANKALIQNCVWLLERLGVSDSETLEVLRQLYEVAEDDSTTLRPRIVEAFGQLAADETRHLLEAEVTAARYYRTRKYAARGLGRIGSQHSIKVLHEALLSEKDSRVIQSLSEAVYDIEAPRRRELIALVKTAQWPENGMVVDETNKWYGNPKIYDSFAEAEDPLCLSLRVALDQLSLPDSAHVLDLGAGTGKFSVFARKYFANSTRIAAIDRSTGMLERLQGKVRFGASGPIPLVCGDAADLPFADESFDAVISSFAFPTSTWDPVRTLKEVREIIRVLKPLGSLVTVGWDEEFSDQLSEFWYRYVPEPDFRRETFEQWRQRRRDKMKSVRNSHLTFTKVGLRVPLLFNTKENAALVMGHLFGAAAGNYVAFQQRLEFSISIGITHDFREKLQLAEERLSEEQHGTRSEQ